jgi:Uma2 family endonuclease
MAIARELIPTQERWTVEEYLAQERNAVAKSEYYDGKIVMMAGGSPTHSLMAMNIGGELYAVLRGTSCRVYSSDLKVRSSPTQYVYPDVTVIYGEFESDDADASVATNPRLIVEVRSPSTKYYDRTGKWLRYQFMPSLTDYLLVAQDQPLVEHFGREEGSYWRYKAFVGLDTELVLPNFDCRIPLVRLYEGVTFAERDGNP